jgi:hypothetical protein
MYISCFLQGLSEGALQITLYDCVLCRPVQPGDLIIAASDGLWDNARDDEVLGCLSNSSQPDAQQVPCALLFRPVAQVHSVSVVACGPSSIWDMGTQLQHDLLRRWRTRLPRWHAGMQLMTPTSRHTLWRPSGRCPLQATP